MSHTVTHPIRPSFCLNPLILLVTLAVSACADTNTLCESHLMPINPPASTTDRPLSESNKGAHP